MLCLYFKYSIVCSLSNKISFLMYQRNKLSSDSTHIYMYKRLADNIKFIKIWANKETKYIIFIIFYYIIFINLYIEKNVFFL